MKPEYITKVSFFTSHKHLNDLINHIYLIGINSFEEQDNSVILYLKPEETFFMDDNIKNVEVAKSRGIHAIQFTGTDENLAEIGKILKIKI